jgi:hypothetical protein
VDSIFSWPKSIRTVVRQTIIKESNAPRVTNVNFSLNVGTVIPRTVTIVVLACDCGGDLSRLARVLLLHRGRSDRDRRAGYPSDRLYYRRLRTEPPQRVTSLRARSLNATDGVLEPNRSLAASCQFSASCGAPRCFRAHPRLSASHQPMGLLSFARRLRRAL